MKNRLFICRILFFTAMLPLFLTNACTRMEEPEKPVPVPEVMPTSAEAKVFYGFTPAEENSKAALDEEARMYWETGDRIALFRSTTNEKYRFNGEHGSVWSEFVKDDESVPGAAFSTNYALYPWAEEVASATEGTLTFSLPDTQTYAEGSFAQNANPMMAVSASYESDELQFQNLCGFMQLRIFGDATIRRIRFYGNNNEVLNGEATVTAAYGSAPSLTLSAEGGKVLTLDCGESGITLGATAGTYTPVWLVVPPTTFTKGFTLEFERTSGAVSTKTTSKSVTITRNHAQPMAAFEVSQYPKDLLSFSLSTAGQTYSAFEIKNGIVSVQVPNSLDMSSMTAIFTHNGAGVSVGGTPQESGVTAQDFSDFTSPVQYVVTGGDGSTQTYTVRMFNLPVVSVETPSRTPIVSKEDWIAGTSISIMTTASDGKRTLTEYANANVKGRGNSSWLQAKKPYAIKLNKKAEVLGMPSHKRWCLLSNCWGYFFGNLMGYELGRRTESIPWSPSGQYVELILNGVYKGCYLLTEQIKIDPNRLNITEIGSTDIAGDALTGGYVLTYDTTWDELFKFRSGSYDMPVMFKIPDEDIPDEQFNYVQNYINTFEALLHDPDSRAAHKYQAYIDIDSFIDQWFVWEIAGMSESHLSYLSDFVAPRSVYYYKDRLQKLKAGPVWDFDSYLFYDKNLRCTTCQYYGDLFKDPAFVARVKEKWSGYRANLDASGGMVAYLDDLYNTVKFAARRDRQLWPWASYVSSRSADDQYAIIRAGITPKLDWLEAQIAAMTVTYDNKGTGTEDYGGQGDKTGDFGFGF